jgi:ABC-type transport system involved in multi-copper enzyme maturation permease subunit
MSRQAGATTREEPAEDGPRAEFRRMEVVLDHEFRGVVRTRSLWLLSAGYAAVVLALTLAGGVGGYLPTVLDLLAPMQLLVPVLAVGFGYGTVLGDADREELEVLRTFPLSRRAYLLGALLGRAAAMLAVVLATLVAAGVVAGVAGGPGTDVLASHAGRDTPAVFLRFLALTALYAVATLAAAVALSALAAGPRSGLALGVGLVVAVGVGFDLGLVGLLAGGYLPDGVLAWLLALSPASAYRALVLGFSGSAGAANALASTLGLLLWTAGGVAAAVGALPRFAGR